MRQPCAKAFLETPPSPSRSASHIPKGSCSFSPIALAFLAAINTQLAWTSSSVAGRNGVGIASARQVGSLGLTLTGSLDVDLFNTWIGEFLRDNSANLFRSKGVLSFKGQERKWVFQVRSSTCASRCWQVVGVLFRASQSDRPVVELAGKMVW